MNIPKYIDKLLTERAVFADKLQDIDMTISDWLDKHNIEVDPVDYRGGVELYEAPYESAARIRQAIREK